MMQRELQKECLASTFFFSRGRRKYQGKVVMLTLRNVRREDPSKRSQNYRERGIYGENTMKKWFVNLNNQNRLTKNK